MKVCVLSPLALALVALPAQQPELQLRLQPLLDGLREEVGGDLGKVAASTLGKEAAKVGLDLTKPGNPVVALACEQGRLFYVFYKVTEEAFGDRAWMIQRIKKTERTWLKDGAAPEEKVTWQVEAFKTIAGTLKGADQHFGSFGLRGAHRREVVKEYEIGFGSIAGRADGAAWPFDTKRLFEMLQEYGDDPALHDQVKFTASRRWSLTVQLAADGSHRVVSPELGLDLPKRVPSLELAKPKPDEASKQIVLTAGSGPPGLTVGASTPADVAKALGAPLEDVPAGASGRNRCYRGALVCNFDGTGVLNTVFTRPSFAGRTKEGITLGMPRAAVKEKLGAAAKDLAADAEQWRVPGLVITFDSAGAVRRLLVTKR